MTTEIKSKWVTINTESELTEIRLNWDLTFKDELVRVTLYFSDATVKEEFAIMSWWVSGSSCSIAFGRTVGDNVVFLPTVRVGVDSGYKCWHLGGEILFAEKRFEEWRIDKRTLYF